MSRAASAIQSDLDAFYALRTAAATNGGIAEYTVDTGQGSQRVRRFSLAEITQTIRDLEAEMLQATGNTYVARFDR